MRLKERIQKQFSSPIDIRTDDLIFKSLIFANGISVPVTLVLFTAEIFDRLVVEEAIGVNATSNLD